MANAEQLNLLMQGIDGWDAWRDSHSDIQVHLSGADLSGADLYGGALYGADLTKADLRGADLTKADLRGADLRGADLRGADLIEAILHQANLGGADLSGTNLYKADLSGADLTKADLSGAILIGTNLRHAKLNDCHIYGLSAWDVDVEGAEQSNLVITPPNQFTITVDNLKVAQFVYLLLNNPQVREVIDTITSKAVLILGRFTPERKAVLDAVRDKLREFGYVSIMFDFEKPEGRNYIETVSTLAHLAKFIIADITDAKVILQELERVIPALPSVPVQPIVQKGSNVNAVILDFVGRLNFIKHLFAYEDIEDVKQSLQEQVIAPAEAKLAEIEQERVLFMEQVRRIAEQ